MRQRVTFDVMQLGADPSVGSPGIFMNTVSDELLTVTEQLDLVAIDAVRIDETDLKLVEWFCCLERYCACGGFTDAYEYCAIITKAIADQLLNGVAGILIEQID